MGVTEACMPGQNLEINSCKHYLIKTFLPLQGGVNAR